MTALTPTHPPYFLNALVERKSSAEIRVVPLTPGTVKDVLKERPVAITVAPCGAFHMDVLLRHAIEEPNVFKQLLESPTKSKKWVLYVATDDRGPFKFEKRVDVDQFFKDTAVFISKHKSHIAALVPDVLDPDHQWKVFVKIFTKALYHGISTAANASTNPGVTAGTDGDEKASSRKALIAVRQHMLDQVGTFSSEELAAAVASTTSNASQYAADQREAGRIFGVRFGKAWRYPKFQFDDTRRPIVEMKEIISALSPDEQGWDRLQWFLEPHEALKGRRPLDVWKMSRNKVVEAARLEHWDGRL